MTTDHASRGVRAGEISGVRLPRGQSRDGQHPERDPGRGGAGEPEAELTPVHGVQASRGGARGHVGRGAPSSRGDGEARRRAGARRGGDRRRSVGAVAPAVMTHHDQGRATVRAIRLAEDIRVDGVLDEPVYRTVPPITRVRPAGARRRRPRHREDPGVDPVRRHERLPLRPGVWDSRSREPVADAEPLGRRIVHRPRLERCRRPSRPATRCGARCRESNWGTLTLVVKGEMLAGSVLTPDATDRTPSAKGAAAVASPDVEAPRAASASA